MTKPNYRLNHRLRQWMRASLGRSIAIEVLRYALGLTVIVLMYKLLEHYFVQ